MKNLLPPLMKRILPYIALALALAQLLLILTSWVWSAAMPLSGVRSMLSSEGIRWFLGHFAELMASPVLVWILLGAMAYGSVVRCRGNLQGNNYRSSRARMPYCFPPAECFGRPHFRPVWYPSPLLAYFSLPFSMVSWQARSRLSPMSTNRWSTACASVPRCCLSTSCSCSSSSHSVSCSPDGPMMLSMRS